MTDVSVRTPDGLRTIEVNGGGGGSPRTYDAVVATVGGDFTSVAAAFASGAATVFVRPGTYMEDSDVVIPPGGALVGAAPGSVAIVMVAGARVKIDGSGRFTAAGTLSVAAGATTVVGVGTAFTTLQALDYVLLADGFYQIASITDDLGLELAVAYQGEPIAAQPTQGQSMIVAASIEAVGIAAPGDTALEVLQAFRCFFRDLSVQVSGGVGLPGWEIFDSGNIVIQSCAAESNVEDGLSIGATLGGSLSVFLLGSSFRNNGGSGLRLDGLSQSVLDSCEIIANGGRGIFMGTTSRIQLLDSFINGNFGIGIDAMATSEETLIGNCTIKGNGSHGVEFSGGPANVVEACIIEGNDGNGINGGDDGIIDGCHVRNNTGIGIDMQGPSNDTAVSSCIVEGNGADGIMASGESCISGNRVRNNVGIGIDVVNAADDVCLNGNNVTGNGSDGVRIQNTSSRCVVVGNSMRGNGGTNFNDLSATTVAGLNQTT